MPSALAPRPRCPGGTKAVKALPGGRAFILGWPVPGISNVSPERPRGARLPSNTWGWGGFSCSSQTTWVSAYPSAGLHTPAASQSRCDFPLASVRAGWSGWRTEAEPGKQTWKHLEIRESPSLSVQVEPSIGEGALEVSGRQPDAHCQDSGRTRFELSPTHPRPDRVIPLSLGFPSGRGDPRTLFWG